jgi:arylsulfatase A-like enzyme
MEVHVFAPLLILACGTPSPPGGDASSTLERLSSGTTSNALALHTAEAVYALPETDWEALGVDPAAIGVWRVTPSRLPSQPKHNSPAYALSLPFELIGDEKGFRPMGLEVAVDGQTVPFARTPAGRSKIAGWRVQGEQLYLTYPGEAAPEEVTVTYPRVARQLSRLSADSGNVPSKRTIAGRTLDGIALPINASATWEITLPTGEARLSADLALEPSMLTSLLPMPAEISLSVARAGHEPELVHQASLSPNDEGFQRWNVPLSAWAGETVELSLKTRAADNRSASADRVFIGNPVVHGDPVDTPRRVILIGLDTFRADKVGAEGRAIATPGFDRFARESVRFERSWTPAPRTRPSFRASTTGRLPLLAVGAENLGETFQRNGWATSGIVANVHLQPRFSFDQGYDVWHFAGDRDADLQVNEAMDWLKDNADRDAFLFLHFMDAHLPYRAPEPFKNQYVTDPDTTMPDKFNRGQVLDWQKRRVLTEQRKVHIEARHDGEIAYLDQALNRLLDELDALPGETLVVMHNDHGEEFWDHGGFEHNHTLNEELVRGLLWFRPTGGLAAGRASQTPATLADIAPTLHALTNLESPPETDGLNLSSWLHDASLSQDWTRPLPLGYLQYGHDRWAVIWQDHKYILHTGTGREELYNLASDPMERDDIAAKRDTSGYLEQLVLAHELEPSSAGPGMRIRLAGNDTLTSLEVTLASTCQQAGVFDPELLVERRANLEWGESARRVVADVGSVVQEADGTAVRFTPGPQPQGTIWLRCEDAPSLEAVSVRVNGELIESKPKGRGLRFASEAGNVDLLPGPLLVPPPGEFIRMQEQQQQNGPDQGDIALLESLGYVGHTEGE